MRTVNNRGQSEATRERVRKHREELRAKGLRPVTRWVPDTRTPEFIAEYRRQWEVLAERYRTSPEAREDLAYWERMATDDGWI
jgi:hypothetical protein